MKTNAILMAAGLGSRLRPLTNTCPKPLLKVNNKPMIETIIEAIKRYPVEKTYIVTGYLGEQFEYLTEKYNDIYLINNPDFDKKNNISSIYAARDILGEADTFICESDLFISDASIFSKKLETSCYFGRMQQGYSDDWVFDVVDGRITRVGKCGTDSYNMVGVSFFKENDARILRDCIVDSYADDANADLFWDDIVNQNLGKLHLVIKEVLEGQIIEIDTVDELRRVNESFGTDK